MTGSRRLRVTLLTPEWPGRSHSGGVARYAQRLAQDLQRAVDLSIVTIGGDSAGLEDARFINVERPRGRFGRYYALPLKLERLIAETAPDVVHSFGDDWAMRHRWPLVRTFHGSALGEAKSSHGLRKANHYILSALEHVSARKADLKVAVGGDSMREFRCDIAMPPVTPIQRRSVPRAGQPTAVFIGSYGGRKRGSMVAAAVRDVRESGRPDARLVVIGPEDDAGNWPEWVEHLSGLDDAAVHSEVSTAWLLAAPSEYEGFGIPAFEALALGTSVVTSATPGSIFLQGLLDGTAGLHLTTDQDFSQEVGKILGGEVPAQSDIPFSQVVPLMTQGSVERLVEDVYPSAQRKFRRQAPGRRV
jgi:glycosyltransferase involved in cell wall biosynthesis